MILLDSDHVTILRMPPSARRTRLVERLALSTGEVIAIPVIAVEETMRGWLAAIARERQPRRQTFAYRELATMFEFFARFSIVPFDEAAADILDGLGGTGIGMSDRKIAAIAIANGALLLTANRRDFERVPGLRHENWMD